MRLDHSFSKFTIKMAAFQLYKAVFNKDVDSGASSFARSRHSLMIAQKSTL